jgi:hypothetical protein
MSVSWQGPPSFGISGPTARSRKRAPFSFGDVKKMLEDRAASYVSSKVTTSKVTTSSVKETKVQGFRAWIGFDARVWSTYGKSPIWISNRG